MYLKGVFVMSELKRISLNVPIATLDRLDVYSKALGINRTSAILMLINTALMQNDMLTTMQKFIYVAENISDEEKSKLNDDNCIEEVKND